MWWAIVLTLMMQLLNTLGDLIGTGLLACPIAFAHAGWIFGPLIMVFIGALTLWTCVIHERQTAIDSPDYRLLR